MPVERFLDAQTALKDDLVPHLDPELWGSEVVVTTLPWQPVVDGNVTLERPIDQIAAGAGAHVDVLAYIPTPFQPHTDRTGYST